MQLFTATFVKNKCIFFTILLQQKLALVMEFFVVFRQVRVWDRKSAGRARDGMVCGVGADTKFQPAQDSCSYFARNTWGINVLIQQNAKSGAIANYWLPFLRALCQVYVFKRMTVNHEVQSYPQAKAQRFGTSDHKRQNTEQSTVSNPSGFKNKM